MATRNGGNTVLALIIGALLVAVAAIGWYLWSGREAVVPDATRLDVDVKLPPTPNLPSPAPIPNPQPTPVPAPVPSPGG